MNDTRLELAEALLQEVVYRSRARQAAGVGLLQGKLAGTPKGPTNCGLGREAAVELGLEGRSAELFEALWPELDATALERIRSALAAWVARQDQLDRDRNHFMKAFRHQHGFDRKAYNPDQLAEWEAGLAEVNGRCNAERELAARALLAG
jgi:hypothetical protein